MKVNRGGAGAIAGGVMVHFSGKVFIRNFINIEITATPPATPPINHPVPPVPGGGSGGDSSEVYIERFINIEIEAERLTILVESVI